MPDAPRSRALANTQHELRPVYPAWYAQSSKPPEPHLTYVSDSAMTRVRNPWWQCAMTGGNDHLIYDGPVELLRIGLVQATATSGAVTQRAGNDERPALAALTWVA